MSSDVCDQRRRTTRVWTAQEYVMAKRMTIHRSRYSIDRKDLDRFIRYLPMHLEAGCCRLRVRHTIRVKDGAFLDWAALFGPIGPNTSILHPLEYYRMRKAKNQLDKIYGLLGLSGEVYKERIHIDYNTSVEVSLLI